MVNRINAEAGLEFVSPTILKRIYWFCIGWRRRWALHMDMAGAPVWLVKWRCPVSPGWGYLLRFLGRRLENPHYEDVYEITEEGRS